MAEAERGPTKKLVMMTIDTDDIDVSNDEAIFANGEAVGYVSSGGFAHHVGKSMAFGYVPCALANDGAELQVEILGSLCPATIVGAALYDANGGKMRG